MPNLWGSAGGNGFMSDPRQRAGLSGTMIGLAQGLLSQQQGEGWASALGRGFGQAGALQRQYQGDFDKDEQSMREQAMRDDFTRMANEATDPREKQMYEIMANAGAGQAAQLFGQSYMAENAAVAAEDRRLRSLEDSIARGVTERREKEQTQIRGERRREDLRAERPEVQEAQAAIAIRRIKNEDPANPELELRAALGLGPTEPLPPRLLERMAVAEGTPALKFLINQILGFNPAGGEGNPTDMPGPPDRTRQGY